MGYIITLKESINKGEFGMWDRFIECDSYELPILGDEFPGISYIPAGCNVTGQMNGWIPCEGIIAIVPKIEKAPVPEVEPVTAEQFLNAQRGITQKLADYLYVTGKADDVEFAKVMELQEQITECLNALESHA